MLDDPDPAPKRRVRVLPLIGGLLLAVAAAGVLPPAVVAVFGQVGQILFVS